MVLQIIIEFIIKYFIDKINKHLTLLKKYYYNLSKVQQEIISMDDR